MVEEVSIRTVNRFLLCAVLVALILYFGQKVLIPLTFSIFFAMLFTPLSNRMEHKGIKRGWTAFISVFILLLATAGIVLMVFLQSKKLAEDFPVIEKKSQEFMHKAQSYISDKLNVPESKQDEMINKQMKSGGESVGNLIKKIFSNIASMLASYVMVLIFTFLFLLQREKYESFFIRILHNTQPDEAKKLISNISHVAQDYLTGRVLSIIIFTVLFSVGFLIVGLKGGLLLAFIAAVLTIVPYVGSIVGGLFPFAVALVTEDNTNVALGALIVVVVVQAVDNYFIEPYIIGGEVSVSAFFTIFILLIGGLMWGVAGMVLFLPMLAVFKIICDAVPSMKPYGYLIGDQGGEKQSSKIFNKIKKIFKS